MAGRRKPASQLARDVAAAMAHGREVIVELSRDVKRRGFIVRKTTDPKLAQAILAKGSKSQSSLTIHLGSTPDPLGETEPIPLDAVQSLRPAPIED